jgi:hypothetical protein
MLKTDLKPDTAASEREMEKDSETQEEGEVDNDDGLMRGTQLVAFTVGMMAVMFLMCLDHYIMGG